MQVKGDSDLIYYIYRPVTSFGIYQSVSDYRNLTKKTDSLLKYFVVVAIFMEQTIKLFFPWKPILQWKAFIYTSENHGHKFLPLADFW